MLTGENKPNKKHNQVVDAQGGKGLDQRKNIAFMGTLVSSGNGIGIVVGTSERTEFGQVFLMMKDIDEKRTPLQLKMDDLGKKLTMISFVIIGFIMLVGKIFFSS